MPFVGKEAKNQLSAIVWLTKRMTHILHGLKVWQPRVDKIMRGYKRIYELVGCFKITLLDKLLKEWVQLVCTIPVETMDSSAFMKHLSAMSPTWKEQWQQALTLAYTLGMLLVSKAMTVVNISDMRKWEQIANLRSCLIPLAMQMMGTSCKQRRDRLFEYLQAFPPSIWPDGISDARYTNNDHLLYILWSPYVDNVYGGCAIRRVARESEDWTWLTNASPHNQLPAYYLMRSGRSSVFANLTLKANYVFNDS